MSDVPTNQAVLCQIANCAFKVVSHLLHRDQLLAKELRSSMTMSRQIFREECITLEMAATLREKFPDHINLTIFTQAEEKRNGADWYWRIQKGTGAIHARVQAKRVRRSAFGQLDSDGVVEFETDQLCRLLETVDSDRSSLPDLQAWIATFARYDASPPCGKEPSRCGSHGCRGSCDGMNELPSVWVAQAQEFANGGAQTKQLAVRKVVESSLRLDCILPCIDRGKIDGPAAKGYTLTPGILPFDACVAAIQANPLLSGTFQGALQIRV
jgi:hypothetical protein